MILTKTYYFPLKHNFQSMDHQINPRIRTPWPLLNLPILTILTPNFNTKSIRSRSGRSLDI